MIATYWKDPTRSTLNITAASLQILVLPWAHRADAPTWGACKRRTLSPPVKVFWGYLSRPELRAPWGRCKGKVKGSVWSSVRCLCRWRKQSSCWLWGATSGASRQGGFLLLVGGAKRLQIKPKCATPLFRMASDRLLLTWSFSFSWIFGTR